MFNKYIGLLVLHVSGPTLGLGFIGQYISNILCKLDGDRGGVGGGNNSSDENRRGGIVVVGGSGVVSVMVASPKLVHSDASGMKATNVMVVAKRRYSLAVVATATVFVAKT